MQYTPDQTIAINLFMNEITINVKENKNLQAVVEWVTQNTYEKFPVYVSVRGEVKSDASFLTDAIVYVAGDRIVLEDMNDIKLLVQPDAGKILHTVVDRNVSMLAHDNYEGSRYAVGSDPTDDYSKESLEEAATQAGKYFNLSKYPKGKEPSLETQALDVRVIFFGTKGIMLHRKTVTVIIFLYLQSTKENAGLFYQVSALFAQLASTRSLVGNIEGKNTLDTLLKRLDTLHEITEIYPYDERGLCSTIPGRGEWDSGSVLEKLRHQVLIDLRRKLRKPLHEGIYRYMRVAVPGYEKWRQARGSPDPRKRLDARIAVATVRGMDEKQEYPNVSLAKHRMKVQRGGSDMFPLGFGNIILPLVRDVAELFGSPVNKTELYDNFEEVMIGDRAKEVHGMSIKALFDMCNDVSFVYGVKMPRSMQD